MSNPKQEPEPIPFDESLAPNGYKAVNVIGCNDCAFRDSPHSLCLGNKCTPHERPDGMFAIFIKKVQK